MSQTALKTFEILFPETQQYCSYRCTGRFRIRIGGVLIRFSDQCRAVESSKECSSVTFLNKKASVEGSGDSSIVLLTRRIELLGMITIDNRRTAECSERKGVTFLRHDKRNEYRL
jgi:hypothetical protein